MKAIYKAENDGVYIAGTAEVIGPKIGYSANYVRRLARTGRKTKDGWRAVVVIPTDNTGIGRKKDVYVAERDGDDPMTGTGEELSELLEMTPEHISYLCRTERTSRDGWRIRKATKEEREAIENESDA